jgi:hypothetical protein
MSEFRYDWQQALGDGVAPMSTEIDHRFRLFCDHMTLAMALKRGRSGRQTERTKVGILVPTGGHRRRGQYTESGGDLGHWIIARDAALASRRRRFVFG